MLAVKQRIPQRSHAANPGEGTELRGEAKGESDSQRSDTDVMAHGHRVEVAFGVQRVRRSALLQSANVEPRWLIAPKA